MLEVRGLSTEALLKDVSFDLRKGEILGFAGLMGAGRTEVGRAVVGADKSISGTIIRGQQIHIRTPADAAKHRIGYLSEDRKQLGLLLEQEVNANIGLSALARAFPERSGFVKDKAMRAASREYVRDLRIKTPSTRRPRRTCRAATSRRSSSPNGSSRTATSSSSTSRPAASTSVPRRRSTASSTSSRNRASRSS